MKILSALLCFGLLIVFCTGCDNNTYDAEDPCITTEKENCPDRETAPSEEGEDAVTVTVTRPDLSIHTGPGYDYEDIGSLLDVGVYTIAEQFVCDEGITWGKLISGMGWIDLDKASAEAPHIPITLERIGKDVPDTSKHHVYIRDDTDNTQYLLLQPYETLTDVTLSFMDFTDHGFQPGEPLYTLAALTEDKPLVLGVVFYGDFTTFGLSFDDASGNKCRYMIYTSGRNGSVVLQKMDS